MHLDAVMMQLFGGLAAFMAIASIAGFVLSRRAKTEGARATARNINARIRAWWVMGLIFAVALATGKIGAVILFALVSFLALREFITITPTRPSDHRTLFWIFFVILPLQYYLLAIEWYGMFIILIPVYAFLFIPVRTLLADDYSRFLERTAKVQWGLMVCVYCVSHAPALMMLDVDGLESSGPKLLFFLVAVVELSDVFQYVWGKSLGRRKVAPNISPNKTFAGLIGGVACASLVGLALWKITPFTPVEAWYVALLISMMGFFGDLTMSAIKRDAGIKDYGSVIGGHGGMLDRIDSLCFAAPVFFHYVRYFHVA